MKKRTFLLGKTDLADGSDRRSEMAMGQDAIRSGAGLLDPIDRLLIQLVLEGQYTRAQIASLMGTSESNLSRRIGRLIRILIRQFPCLFGHSSRGPSGGWKMLRMSRLHRQSVKAMALQTGWSLYQVRKTIDGLKRIRKTIN